MLSVNMSPLSIVVCALLGVAGALMPGNEIIDKILEEGNKLIPRESYLPETFTFEMGDKTVITAYGARVTREHDNIVRKRNANYNEHMVNCYVTCGAINVTFDKVVTETPWKSYESSVVLTLPWDFYIESVIDRAADCHKCTVLRSFDLDIPKLQIHTKGLWGKLFDLTVRRMEGSKFMNRVLRRLFEPPFTKTIIEPLRPAAIDVLCKCKKP